MAAAGCPQARAMAEYPTRQIALFPVPELPASSTHRGWLPGALTVAPYLSDVSSAQRCLIGQRGVRRSTFPVRADRATVQRDRLASGGSLPCTTTFTTTWSTHSEPGRPEPTTTPTLPAVQRRRDGSTSSARAV